MCFRKRNKSFRLTIRTPAFWMWWYFFTLSNYRRTNPIWINPRRINSRRKTSIKTNPRRMNKGLFKRFYFRAFLLRFVPRGFVLLGFVPLGFVLLGVVLIEGCGWYWRANLEGKLRKPSPSSHAILSSNWFLS